MTQIIGLERRCASCDKWFSIWEVDCPHCGARNNPIDVFTLRAQLEMTQAKEAQRKEAIPPNFGLGEQEAFPLPEGGCKSCVHNNPYEAKNCMLCPEADKEPLLTNVAPLRPSVENSSRSVHRLKLFAVSATIGCFVLGGALLARPLTELDNARTQEKAAAKEAEEQALERLWRDYRKVQADEGRDQAIAYVTELTKEKKTKAAAGTILNWCRKNGPEQVAFKKAFEINNLYIGADGVTALSGENYSTYMRSGNELRFGENTCSVEFLLSNNATFEATLLISEEAWRIPENAEVWEDIKVTFLGSGGKVLDTFADFEKREGPRFVCVSVDGEDSLKIVFESCAAHGGILGFELTQLVILGDPVLTPAYAEAA